jgi:Ca2+-binding EF-hand superfamily protein
MKRIITTFAALAMSAAFTIAADEAKKPDAAPAPATEKKAGDPEKAFARKDKDNDGNLTKEEFVAGAKDAAKAEAAFAKRDANGDGKVSKEEFAAQPAKKK